MRNYVIKGKFSYSVEINFRMILFFYALKKKIMSIRSTLQSTNYALLNSVQNFKKVATFVIALDEKLKIALYNPYL